MHETTDAAGPPRRLLVWILVAVGLVALLARGVFVAQVLSHLSAEQLLDYGPDTAQYVHLARNLAFDGRYAQNDPTSHYTALLRTPGYPAFVAIFLRLHWAPASVLVAQAAMASCIPLITALLAWALLRSRLAALAAGMASALSPTGVGVTGIVLVEALFGVAFLLGFGLLYLGIAADRWRLACTAGVVFGVAALIKPTLLFWPVISPVLWFVLARATDRTVRWKPLLLFVVVQLPIPLAWCTHNYATDGFFALSSVGPQSLRYHIAPRVEEWARAGGMPRADAVIRNRDTAKLRDEAEMAAGSPAADIIRRQTEESTPILRANPRLTARLWLANIIENIRETWPHFSTQLPEGSLSQRGWERLSRALVRLQKPLLLLVVVAMLELLVRPRRRRSDAWRRQLYGLLALAGTYGYFAFFTGISYWQGSRLLYPVEFALILIVVIATVSLARSARAAISSQSS
ncbi:MAG: hypothetical protein JXA69_16660 [Phycisphaerae bacterium]|nr:hypothetical protein [Phycisphaerae bacterium]